MIDRTAKSAIVGATAATLLSLGAWATHTEESVGPMIRATARPKSLGIMPFAPPAGLRFDLVCQGIRRFDTAEAKPGARAYQPLRPYDEVTRHLVDLEAMRECDPLTCELQGPTKISITPDALIFYEGRDLLYFYHWRSGVSESRGSRDGRTHVIQGSCRIEPFSGFPPRRPRMIMVREREGTGSHPFVHEGPHPDDELIGAESL